MTCAAVVALAGAVGTEAAAAQSGCNTQACKKRVAERAFARAHGGCRSWACVGRVRRTYWQRESRKLGPAVHGMLARLRGCETRGIPFPANYRLDGHHDGAYQYDQSTWKEAGGTTTFAYEASPAEQDVVTARFYPGHRSRWDCQA